MKVLQVLLPLGFGGVERISADLHKYILSKDSESFVAIDEDFIDEYIKNYKIKDTTRIIPIKKSKFLGYFLNIKKIINDVNPDIVHTHARRECVIISTLKKDFVHIRTQHMEEHPQKPVTYFEKVLLNKNVEVWVSTSKKLAMNYLKEKGIDHKKIKVIYNGIESLSENRKNDINTGKKYKFCFLGRLTKQKGIDILLKDIISLDKEILAKFQLDIIGEGEELISLKNYVNNSNLSNYINFYGYTRTPLEVLSKYDILLMPSRNEGLPLVMLESMSVKTPVAIHDVGCISEIINNEINGWIINRNQGSWKAFIENAINGTYDIKAISNNAFNTYYSNFTRELMCNNYYELYEIANKNKGRIY